MAKEKENKVKNDKKHFMKDFKAELKKVVWPTSKQLINNVTAVIAIVLITAAIVFVLDLVFMGMNEYGVNKLKTHIQSKEQSQSQDVNNTVNNEQTDSNNENASSNENSQEANNQNTENNNTAE
nr:preprotein translocase subunit SecE [Clostridia bacterium]